MYQRLRKIFFKLTLTSMAFFFTVTLLYAQSAETPSLSFDDDIGTGVEVQPLSSSAYEGSATITLAPLSITIIESQSFVAGHVMDDNWFAVATSMGHTATINPQTLLDSTAFFSTTDILIVASGIIAIPTNRRTIIRQFIEQGGTAYIQGEYLCNTYDANATFQEIVSALGGSFSWGTTTVGDLVPMNVLGALSNTNNSVPILSYFWYGCTGSGDTTIENYLEYGGQNYGFIFSPPNGAHGSVITNSDQDWVRVGAERNLLMENIITRLIPTSNNPVPDIKANGSDVPINLSPVENLSVTIALASGDQTGVNADWWALAETPFGWYRYNLGSDSWVRGQDVTYQGPLMNLATREILNMTGLPAGTYTIHFDVDTTVNAVRDTPIFSDSIGVSVSSSCQLGSDTDNDRLDDCYETNTGVYVSPTNTGTDPNNPDTDADALNDGDEVLGTLQGLNLPAMGAIPTKQDIFIEYDWFNDSLGCAAHSHRPTQNAANMVTQAFANSTVLNPDGTTGITFHHDLGQGGLFNGGNLIADADGVLTGGVNNAEFLAHKAANFAANREGYFHYTILPHRYNTNSGSSGQAELPGDDLIVSLQCFNSDTNIGHTIMHELGHNLNIRHGGSSNCNYKPNYNSVMNYLYQFPGIDNNCTPQGDGVLSYSIGDRITLNESSLNENLGTCGTVAWDWNGNAVLESNIVYDINTSGNSTCGGILTVLTDFNDWANLFMTGLLDADGVLPYGLKEVITCENPAPPTK